MYSFVWCTTFLPFLALSPGKLWEAGKQDGRALAGRKEKGKQRIVCLGSERKLIWKSNPCEEILCNLSHYKHVNTDCRSEKCSVGIRGYHIPARYPSGGKEFQPSSCAPMKCYGIHFSTDGGWPRRAWSVVLMLFRTCHRIPTPQRAIILSFMSRRDTACMILRGGRTSESSWSVLAKSPVQISIQTQQS